jgi:hypothetical protein
MYNLKMCKNKDAQAIAKFNIVKIMAMMWWENEKSQLLPLEPSHHEAVAAISTFGGTTLDLGQYQPKIMAQPVQVPKWFMDVD